MNAKRKTWVRVPGKDLANDWARPIVVALSWLERNHLLTAAGRQMMRSPFERLALTSDCVTDSGRRFLDMYWKKWYSERGLMLAFMGYGNAKEDFDYLDELYSQLKSSRPSAPPKRRPARQRTTRTRRRGGGR